MWNQNWSTRSLLDRAFRLVGYSVHFHGTPAVTFSRTRRPSLEPPVFVQWNVHWCTGLTAALFGVQLHPPPVWSWFVFTRVVLSACSVYVMHLLLFGGVARGDGGGGGGVSRVGGGWGGWGGVWGGGGVGWGEVMAGCVGVLCGGSVGGWGGVVVWVGVVGWWLVVFFCVFFSVFFLLFSLCLLGGGCVLSAYSLTPPPHQPTSFLFFFFSLFLFFFFCSFDFWYPKKKALSGAGLPPRRDHLGLRLRRAADRRPRACEPATLARRPLAPARLPSSNLIGDDSAQHSRTPATTRASSARLAKGLHPSLIRIPRRRRSRDCRSSVELRVPDRNARAARASSRLHPTAGDPGARRLKSHI